MLEIMGDFDSNERVISTFGALLTKEDFEVEQYAHEDFMTAKFDVHTLREKYDLVIYLGNVGNASNKVTNRLNWFTFWGNGNNVPWFYSGKPSPAEKEELDNLRGRGYKLELDPYPKILSLFCSNWA